jgi:zinc D-Ala-D-Ala carboxypeptidase
VTGVRWVTQDRVAPVDGYGVEGVAAIQGRIAAIESRFAVARSHAPAGVGAPAPVGARTSPFSTAFAEALAGVATEGVALGSTGPTTPARRLAPGAYGRLEPPAELAAYGNGRIPPDALVPLGEGSHRLWAPAARAYRQLITAARAEGIEIGITDSYRDLAGQQRLAATKGLYSQGGLAATPGTSNHGWGLAVDLRLDDRAQSWMRDHAWRFGFVEDVPREPWHWTYRPAD